MNDCLLTILIVTAFAGPGLFLVIVLRNFGPLKFRLTRAIPHVVLAKAVAVFALGILAGSAVSELWLSWDEKLFIAESEALQPRQRYEWARAWPNGTYTMVYTPDGGFIGTDGN